jgi:putative hemolysin
MTAWTAFAVLAAALACVCVLAAVYAALTTVPRALVEEQAERRKSSAGARCMERVLEEPESHARAVGGLVVVFTVVAVLSAVAWVAALRAPGVPAAPTDGVAATSSGAAGPGVVGGVGGVVSPDGWDVALGAVLGAGLLWVFGVVVPAALARHAGARLLVSTGVLIRALHTGAAPVRTAGALLDEVVRRLVGAERQDAQEQVQAELLSVIEEGEAKGALEEEDREMLEAVVRFRDLTVAQIMTPRTQIEAMELSNDLGAVTRTIRRLGHSRIPVYEENLDHVVGIFYVKDLMHWLGGDAVRSGQKFELRALLRPATFVPETKTVKELLKELTARNVHIALVADEYGGTAGLVTIEDIVEEIFGDIKDEYEPPAPETPEVILRPEQRRAELDASARIMDVNGALEPLGVQIPESEDYDTVGGFIVTALGRIPAPGETFRHESMLFTVVEAKPTRVVKVTLEVRSDEEAPVENAPRGA